MDKELAEPVIIINVPQDHMWRAGTRRLCAEMCRTLHMAAFSFHSREYFRVVAG